MQSTLSKIRFEIRRSRNSFDEVGIVIDDIDLIERVRTFELPLATAEARPSIAGSYSGLSPDDVLPPARHFLGEVKPIYRYNQRAQVLGCECGEPGCWPLTCRIQVQPTSVRWFDFCQPHRQGGRPDSLKAKAVWHYHGFGPFDFERHQYEDALHAVKRGAA